MYTADYGDLKVTYKMECEGEKNYAIITGFNGEWQGEDFDYRDIADIKFICESDFSSKQFAHYMKTGETL